MENPTFKLESVVKTSNDLEDFEGPLTLILQLLSKNRIEIRDIKIAELLDQYVAYLDEMKAMDLEIASDFVMMASHLVYIKARMLISAEAEQPTELEELINSLEKLKNRDTYENVKKITPQLAIMYKRGAGTITKPPEYISVNRTYKYVHEKEDVFQAIVRVLSRSDMAQVFNEIEELRVPSRIVYPVTDKTEEILGLLLRDGDIGLKTFFGNSRSRTELVATFVALLELCRAGRISFFDDGDNIMVSRMADAG